jgi:hypothetical protein
MANFYAYPGMFVMCANDFKQFKKGEEYQILSVGERVCGYQVTFVGIKDRLTERELSINFELIHIEK